MKYELKIVNNNGEELSRPHGFIFPKHSKSSDDFFLRTIKKMYDSSYMAFRADYILGKFDKRIKLKFLDDDKKEAILKDKEKLIGIGYEFVD